MLRECENMRLKGGGKNHFCKRTPRGATKVAITEPKEKKLRQRVKRKLMNPQNFLLSFPHVNWEGKVMENQTRAKNQPTDEIEPEATSEQNEKAEREPGKTIAGLLGKKHETWRRKEAKMKRKPRI